MLKWLLLGIVIVVAGWWGLRQYAMDHATEEGSFSAGLYERRIEDQLRAVCNSFAEEIKPREDQNTSAQYEATCSCFANDMFEKVRTVPPDELQGHLDQETTKASVRNILKKCANAAGLN